MNKNKIVEYNEIIGVIRYERERNESEKKSEAYGNLGKDRRIGLSRFELLTDQLSTDYSNH